jgi:hypothetical protein
MDVIKQYLGILEVDNSITNKSLTISETQGSILDAQSSNKI